MATRGTRHVAADRWPAHIPAAAQLGADDLAFFDAFGYLHLCVRLRPAPAPTH